MKANAPLALSAQATENTSSTPMNASAAVPAQAFAPRKLSAKNNSTFISAIGKRPFYDGLFSFAPE